jgi:hypothetical protein
VANGKNLPDLGNPGVYPALLGFKTFDGGIEYFGVGLLGWHLELVWLNPVAPRYQQAEEEAGCKDPQ